MTADSVAQNISIDLLTVKLLDPDITVRAKIEVIDALRQYGRVPGEAADYALGLSSARWWTTLFEGREKRELRQTAKALVDELGLNHESIVLHRSYQKSL